MRLWCYIYRCREWTKLLSIHFWIGISPPVFGSTMGKNLAAH